jgi:hypothetical protein
MAQRPGRGLPRGSSTGRARPAPPDLLFRRSAPPDAASRVPEVPAGLRVGRVATPAPRVAPASPGPRRPAPPAARPRAPARKRDFPARSRSTSVDPAEEAGRSAGPGWGSGSCVEPAPPPVAENSATTPRLYRLPLRLAARSTPSSRSRARPILPQSRNGSVATPAVPVRTRLSSSVSGCCEPGTGSELADLVPGARFPFWVRARGPRHASAKTHEASTLRRRPRARGELWRRVRAPE